MKKTALIMVLALCFSAFVSAQSRTEVNKSSLPKSITENISKDYNGYSIQKAFKVNTKNQLTYEVIIAKGTQHEKLEYNSDGAFIRKEPMEHASAQKMHSNKTTTSHKSAAQKSTESNTKPNKN